MCDADSLGRMSRELSKVLEIKEGRMISGIETSISRDTEAGAYWGPQMSDSLSRVVELIGIHRPCPHVTLSLGPCIALLLARVHLLSRQNHLGLLLLY